MTINAFTLHETATAPAASVELLDDVRKGLGFVPNLQRVMAESPAALEAHSMLLGIAEKTRFSPVERNIAYLSIIYENECAYCMAGHTNLSRMAGRLDRLLADFAWDRMDRVFAAELNTPSASPVRGRGKAA